MTEFNLYEATGLTSQELAEVFQYNPRAYMAVRGAVAEKHLEKVLENLMQRGDIDDYRSALGDMEKDFYLQVQGKPITLECKNVEVIKTSNNKSSQLGYVEYLAEQGHLSSLLIENILREIGPLKNSLQNLSSSNLKNFFKRLPQKYRESGLVKYQYSASKVPHPKLGQLPDNDFINQFSQSPMTIDFQRTRNSTNEDGDTRRNRYYQVGEIDIVAACLFARTMEWKFLYAEAKNFEKHAQYSDRYSNRLRIEPGFWTSDLVELIST
ncbi:hypothetical protein IQ260_29350 [Leptolyngbya cf. ectocarpi LEGE 11479]|uniref:Uncharacterized protein n=1 Tax=Leptolyngbya cf. ectocarpi LEGE 11479 TaxID=1828722 RepID=A0A929FD71_LEPEC|nr:hypothetical protein [Leptolyngbya ectocarpi]MBE9070749.1 hypothetical protein [Leptolyngbya cf. ectocarpi LEGE 11479]